LTSDDSLPTIVAGDLNAAPQGFPLSERTTQNRNSIETLMKRNLFQTLPVQSPATPQDLTYDSLQPDRVIDWILIPPQWSYADYVVDDCHLSDHRPVYADVIIVNKPSEIREDHTTVP
ncbi:MAG: hypothetical protein KDA85_05070, partial [Planctomycetaceae bacterium]|nr:hypothetical protein [Planctomycetaceae bacterium]